jgi:putative nucleotidyltransferase with HDIG domain
MYAVMTFRTASPSRLEAARLALRAHLHASQIPGAAALILTLFVLAAGSGMQPEHRPRLFLAGEIATADVVADRNLHVEDSQATKARRDQLTGTQPIVFDLYGAEADRVKRHFFEIFRLANVDYLYEQTGGAAAVSPDAAPLPGERNSAEASGDAQPSRFVEEVTQYLYALSGIVFERENIRALGSPRLQAYMTEKGLPWLEARLQEGVVSDSRLLRSAGGGMLIRNMDTGQEMLRPQGGDLHDLATLMALFAQHLRAEPSLNPVERRTINHLAGALITPSLTINREATQALGAAIGQSVDPVYYRISKGEVIVHQGERVTREQQLKLQSLFRKGKTFLRPAETIGAFGVSLFLALGLFTSPGGRPGSPMRCRDLLLISVLLLAFGLAAKGLYLAGPRLLEGTYLTSLGALSFAFPVTAVSGLSALIFASRRYRVTGLLASMHAALLLNGGMALFLFYFISAMGNTWLVLRAQSRQDMVRSILPLGACMLPLGFAAALLEGFPMTEWLSLAVCLLISLVLTQFIMFASSPLLELGFRYTTRFRLMELLNLEQPLLQNLMVSAPGTYHHSLVTSNLVEAGAKSVGANSLLCKVGALYHDIGKLAYPDYFIENQYGGSNRHDALAPAMSALILVSHVKKGVELARKYRLGEDIEDIIRQHHGTNLIHFFYQKAQEQAPGEVLRAEDFQYPGPRPQSREAAIVLTADIAEASCRTLSDPTPARIKTHIDAVLRNIFTGGQLDESALTFQDLRRLSDSYERILIGLFHQRIAYPDSSKGKTSHAGDAGQEPASGNGHAPETPAQAAR